MDLSLELRVQPSVPPRHERGSRAVNGADAPERDGDQTRRTSGARVGGGGSSGGEVSLTVLAAKTGT